jgi:hypothetical protein
VIQPATITEREATGGQEMTTYFNPRRDADGVLLTSHSGRRFVGNEACSGSRRVVEMVLMQMIVLLLLLLLLLLLPLVLLLLLL